MDNFNGMSGDDKIALAIITAVVLVVCTVSSLMFAYNIHQDKSVTECIKITRAIPDCQRAY